MGRIERPIKTAPESAAGVGGDWYTGPKTSFTASSSMSTKAKVSRSWNASGAEYTRRRNPNSITQPAAATSSGPAISATQKLPLIRNATQAKYAPSMYRLPCAKFSTRITPKISDSPAATSHRYMASLRPTRPWKSTQPSTGANGGLR